MSQITSKLEINLDNPIIPITEVNSFAIKNKVAAVVVHDWQLVNPLTQLKLSSGGRYSIILAVDFPNGNEYVLDKFKVFNKDIDMSLMDGFDILLTARKPDGNPPGEIEALNEIQALRDFLFSINRTYQVRYVIDIFSRENTLVDHALKAFKRVPPTMIRLDHNLSMPDRVNPESIQKAIDTVRRYTAAPVKVSTNVTLDLIRAVAAPRYDVTFEVAQKIVEELQKPVAPEPTPEPTPTVEAKVDGAKPKKIVELSGTAKQARASAGMGKKAKS